MTPDEHEQLTRFLQLLGQAQAGAKDPAAEALIREACARQPDAAYLLVQHTLQVEAALLAAQAQTAQLQKELGEARSKLPPSSFLAGANAWGHQPSVSGVSALSAASPASQFAAQPAMVRSGQPVSQPAPYPMAAAAPASSWGSGMLGTVAMTAAGVVAGGLLYQGISGMIGSHNKEQAAIPPGGGTLDSSNRYGDSSADRNADGGYVTDDFDTSDSGGSGDSGDSGDLS